MANRRLLKDVRKRKQNKDKNIAITIFSSPPDKGNVGTAAYLDVFDSIQAVLKQMKSEGYDIGDAPETKEEIKGLPQDAHVYHQHLAVLDVEGDLLVMRKSPGFNKEVQRILVPNNAKLRDEIFRFSHMHPSAGHFGTQATSARVALKFYSPGMASELKQQKCDTCLAKIQWTKWTWKVELHMPSVLDDKLRDFTFIAIMCLRYKNLMKSYLYMFLDRLVRLVYRACSIWLV